VRILELDAGSIDLLQETFEPELVTYLRARPGLTVSRTPGTSVAYLALGFGDPRLRNRRVRRALALAIDRDGLVTSLLGDTARPATGLLAPEHWAYRTTPKPRHDPRRAGRLLDRAGYPDPDGPGPAVRFRLVYKTSTQPARRRIAEAIQADLAAVGIALDIRTYEWGTLFADVRQGRFELAAMTWVGVADPDLYRLAYHSAMTPPTGLNRGRYASRPFDRLARRAQRTLDPTRRRHLYGRIQRWAAHDLPAIVLWWEDRLVATTDRLQGFSPQPSGDLRGLATATLR
jgi:peptide/nickel transport system substrate-binding protein